MQLTKTDATDCTALAWTEGCRVRRLKRRKDLCRISAAELLGSKDGRPETVRKG